MKNKIEIEAIHRGYFVTETGILMNKHNSKIGHLSHYNYICTNISMNGIICKLMSHRLQAYQKYGDKLYKDGIVVRHLNGNCLDNSWDNILIGTHSENMMDIPEQIRIKKALHATSFVRKYEKQEVIDFYNKCKSYKKTMSEFNISSKGTLHYILNR